MPYHCHLRCKAGLHYGWGHLIRATALGAFLRQQSDTWRVTFAAEGEAASRAFLDGHDFADAIVLSPDDDAEQRLLDADPPELVVVDMLEPSPAFLARYRREGCKVLVFSDTGIPHANADLVICPNPEDVWAQNRTERMIGGLDYVIVPESIAAAGRSRAPEPPKARRLFVNMGGGVSRPVFAKVAEVLERLATDGFHGCFVMGYDRDFDIDDDVRRRLDAYTLIDGTDRIAELFADSELAFTAAGYMRYELAAAGLPAMLVSLAAHQDWFGGMFAAKGIADYGGSIRDCDTAALAKKIVSLAGDPSRRTQYSDTGRRLVDGKALSRIAAAAEGLLRG